GAARFTVTAADPTLLPSRVTENVYVPSSGPAAGAPAYCGTHASAHAARQGAIRAVIRDVSMRYPPVTIPATTLAFSAPLRKACVPESDGAAPAAAGCDAS